MKRLIMLSILIPVFFLGCQKKKETYASDYEQAQVLMEEGKYNSVITLLEPALAKRPEDQSMRLLLASAYAARGGVFITSFTSLAKSFLSNPVGATSPTREAALLESIQQIKSYLEKFNSIPNIETDKQWMDVERAFSIIEMDSNNSGGAAAYAGLLRLVSFRYQLLIQENFFAISSCQITAKFLLVKLNFIFSQTSGILSAFMRATPKADEKQILQSHISNLSYNHNLLSSWISGAESLDDFKITQIFPKCSP